MHVLGLILKNLERGTDMLFGKHVNRYYVKHAPMLLLGILALVLVDYFQLEIPELYGLVVNGTNAVIKSREAAAEGITLIPEIMYKGEMVVFNLDFVLDKICLPMIRWRRICACVCLTDAKFFPRTFTRQIRSAHLCRCLQTTLKRYTKASARVS